MNIDHPMAQPWLCWQSMKDAPRDGKSWILLYCRNRYGPPYRIAQWNVKTKCWVSGEGMMTEGPLGQMLWAYIPEPQP